jgi:hypothetical protein
VDVPRPPVIGNPSIVRQLRSVLFSEPILGAAGVRPRGLTKATVLTLLLGWIGPLLARRATDPLPPTLLYIAVTTVDIRIFSKPTFAEPFEVGRWNRGSYLATIREGGLSLKLELELERLGRVTLSAAKSVRPVFDLVVQGARGPVI